VLRALKQLIRPGGRIAYTTIFVTPGLEPKRRRRAQRSGPRAVASRSGQRRLLASAGFTEIDVVDLTTEWASTARGWLDGWSANEAELTALDSAATFAQRQRERRTQLHAIEDGLLRRGLFSATRAR
jgi:hypothetical protein